VKPLLHILALWRSRAGWLLAGAALSMAAVAAGVALMVQSGRAVGIAIVAGTLAAPSLLRGLGALRVILRYAERLVTHAATFRALADLRVWFFRGLAKGAAGGLGFRRAGDVLSRLVNDVEALDGLYLRILIPLAGALLLIPALGIFIGRNFPLLAAAVVVLFAIAAFLLPVLAARQAKAAGSDLTRALSALRVAALDLLSGMKEVLAFGAEGRMLAQIQAREDALFAAQARVAKRSAWAGAAAFLCGQAALLAVLALAGAAPLGAIAITFLVVASFEVVAGLPRAGVLAGAAAAAAERVLEAAQSPAPVADPPHPLPLPRGFGLRFEAVSFRWQPDRPMVFDGLSLDIPERSRVAILGPSGAGKSTLAALALKVVAPQSGRVLLGGVDIAALSAADVRARIGWLSQSTHLFDDTIRANLLLAAPTADEQALWEVLDQAQIGAFVRALPDGLDTWVGEKGLRFSGGQGRRLALARALLSPAPILILDEPCSGLDADTERAFLLTLNDVAKDRTVILIAHRLLGVERLDRVWRISGGRALAAAC